MFYLHSVVASTLFMLILSVVIINGNYSDAENDEIHITNRRDLIIYFKSLRQILSFCSQHKQDLDMNFVFGLFITSVNLKKALLDNKNRMPPTVQSYIIVLLKENDDLINFFDYMVEKNHDPREKTNKIITTLFSNETQWLKQLHNLNSVLLKKSAVSNLQLKQISASFDAYSQNVANTEYWIPHPRISDMCMAALANNEIHNSTDSRCNVYEACYHIVTNGTNFGYALTHRLLLLLMARLGRGCNVFSKKEDRAWTKHFCTTAFDEARFIAMNDYKLVDLFLEQMCLCSLAGFPQYLRRSWLFDIIRFQTPYGCFGQRLPEDTAIPPYVSRHPRAWKLSKHMDHSIMDGQCDGHLTSVAAGTLAIAIRYIFELEVYRDKNDILD